MMKMRMKKNANKIIYERIFNIDAKFNRLFKKSIIELFFIVFFVCAVNFANRIENIEFVIKNYIIYRHYEFQFAVSNNTILLL